MPFRRSFPAALTAALVGLAAQAAPAADEPPLRFAWPVPSHARVTEKILKKGREAVLRYQASLVRGAGTHLELRLSDVEFLRSPLAGVPTIALLVEGLLDVLQPTLVISREGLLQDVVGFERATEAGLALARSTVNDPQALKTVEALFRSPRIMAAMKRKSGEFWELWAGAWAGAELRRGDDFAADIPLPLPDGTSVKQSTRVRHLGPDPQVKGHVRLSLEGTLEGPEFTAAMARLMGDLLRDATAKELVPADVLTSIRRDTRLSVVTEAATLRPREARSELTTTITLKDGQTRTLVERREYTFEWLAAPPLKKYSQLAPGRLGPRP